MRWAKALRFAGLFACSLGLLGVDDPDTAGKASPSAAQVIPIRLGSVDAVRGNLSLAIPLGPKLPGRLPVGLVWRFDSQDPVHFRAGGSFAAVVWPVSGAVSGYGFWSPTVDVQVGATTYSFLYSHSATSGVPADGEVSSLLTARGVDIGSAEVTPFDQRTFKVSAKRPSSDGTRWYFETCWQVYTKIGSHMGEDVWGYKDVAQRKAIIDGPNAIWTGDGAGNHFTNRWGDHVVAEPYGSGGIRLYNKHSPSEHVQLALSLPTGSKVAVGEKTFQVWQLPANLDDPALRATIEVTNGLGLPSVTIKGIYREKLTQVGDPGGRPGFIPITWTVTSGTESTTTQFTWSAMGSEEVPTTIQDPEGPGFTKMVPAPIATLTTLTHPNGMVERFNYGSLNGNLSSKAFSGGMWVGYRIGLSSRETAFSEIPNPSSMPAVASIITEDGALGRSVLIVRRQPLISKAAGTTSYSWAQSDHVTWVLQYPKAAPSTGESFRGFRIVHPSANNAASPTSASAFLFTTSAVLATERIHGAGAPANLALPGTWLPSSPVVDQVTVMDGWDLRSWANPTGSLTAGLPVTAVAARTTVYTPKLPLKITVAGRLRDTWGPVSTDEFTLPPAALPAKDGTNPGVWSSGLGAQSGNLQRTGVISRHWDSAALELVTDSDEKTLSGSDLPGLRGVSSVTFGQTAFSHETGTALLKTTTGTRDGAVAQETRAYVAGKPLVESVTKSLTQGSALPYSNSIGTTYTYDTTPHRWLIAETDKLTGRTTNYQRDALGRVTLTTDPNGVQIQTEYDGWGRVSKTTRPVKGAAGSLVTAYAYDPAGLWKTETVTADGRSLTTRTEFDKHGRVIRVAFPDGSIQLTGYDGWGQKIWQTPVLKPGQAGYGNFTWTYSDKGQVMASFDPKGRRLSSAYDPAVGPSGLWEPQEVAGEGIVTKTWDDRGYLRKEVHDRLGQKRKVVDQANQPSTYTYDRDGHLVSTTQGTQTRSYAYDPKTGWLTSRTEPEEGTTTYGDFTALGTPRYSKMTGRNNQSNVETFTTLDAWHRPTLIEVKNAGALAVRRALTYRNDFNLPASLTETQSGGTLAETYGYDDLARLNLKTVSDGTQTFTVSRTFDASGNVVSLTYPSGGGRGAQTATTEFDTLNRPWVLRMDNAVRAQMTYGAASGTGWTDTLLYGNGATTASGTDQGELVSVIHQVMSGLPGNQQVNRMTWSAGGLLLSRGPSATAGNAANDRFDYDALQRLTYAKTWGINGELAEQWFRYDTWGNRIRSDYTYAANGGMAKPDELMAWSATYDGGNRLPTQVNGLAPGSTAGGTTAGTASGSLPTGAGYDDLGRIASVNAIPGNMATQTAWAYDPSGRITSETVNGVTTTFLLDGEGLRFKRMKADGSVQYTVYGFGREPLSVFSKPASGPGGGGNLWQGSTSATLTAASNGWDGIHYTIPCVAGEVFSGECIARTAGMTAGGAILGIRFDSDSQIAIGWANWSVVYGTERVRLTTTGVAPAGATKALIYINVGPCNPGAQGIFEGLAFWRGPAPNRYLWQGSTSATLTAASNGWDGIHYTVPCVAGEVFSGECIARTVGMTAGGAILGIRFDSDSQIAIGWANWSVAYGTERVRLTTTGVAPAGTTKALVYINVGPCNPGAQGIFDGLAFWRGSGPNPGDLIFERSMVYGFGTLISEERPEGTIYVQGDQVGSPNVLTNASGAVVGRSKNLPFGERFGSSGEKASRRYTNHEDQDGSAVYMQARTYLPAYGKFAQVDPAYDQTKDDPESWNLYNYVTNNPVTHTDPDGREASLGTMGVGFTNWFWDAVADYDAMVAKAQSQHADQATKDLPGSNNQTKPQEGRAPETKTTTTTTSTSPPAEDKPATEAAQTGGNLSPGGTTQAGGNQVQALGGGKFIVNGITVQLTRSADFGADVEAQKGKEGMRALVDAVSTITQSNSWASLQKKNRGISTIEIVINNRKNKTAFSADWIDKASGVFGINANPFVSMREANSGNAFPLSAAIFHELGHSVEYLPRSAPAPMRQAMEERNVRKWENPYRSEMGMPLRNGYSVVEFN